MALVACGATPKKSLKNVETKANELAAEVRQLGLEIKLLKMEVIIYYRTRIESFVGEEIVIIKHIMKTS